MEESKLLVAVAEPLEKAECDPNVRKVVLDILSHWEVTGKTETVVDRLTTELERAYRALGGFYHRIRQGQMPDDAMLGYHAPTIAAARRFISTGEVGEGSEYFIGKSVDELHAALRE